MTGGTGIEGWDRDGKVGEKEIGWRMRHRTFVPMIPA